ncbi:DUF6193 family natural product biosynthesis protein [Streptomyces sp. NBC_01257]|uniref:DUF6193 family natural product biosynthesis protein n=1 Tax=Streptomyces sp. NBC_01257 TaxID=2903799 RepID=UPI002DDB5841|nr:DUF6193 family natural product biosynthesis protein [Streptomyces sp. NBC_01257]WRZ69685.1 DUF4265 domain-containing protein [Streptomyces sp. NBC_01257]
MSLSNRSDAPRPTTSRAPTWPPFDLDGQVEQLWLKAVNDGSYEVACIPFSAYGIALGDVVLLNNGRFKVRRRHPFAVIGEVDTAEEAVALVLELLPTGSDPVITASADERV